MLIDEVYITIKSGKGGPGAVSFFPGRKSGPDGGNGGNGGDVYVKAVKGLNGLNRMALKRKYEAGDGNPGQSFRREGEDGEDIELEVPVGTTFIDQDTKQGLELDQEGQRVLIARGGRGGRGNESFKSSTYQAPRRAELGKPGEEKHFKVVLKLIADYGLIGLPNAGKSSLLNEITAANAKTADYPFTTLEPNLGVINGKVIADIPGLIEGASKGKGLGMKFLKHIEKVTLLLHCIAADNEDVEKIYNVVINELEKYNPALIAKKQIILLTKHDLVTPAELKKKKKILSKYNKDIHLLSIHDWDSLEALKKTLS